MVLEGGGSRPYSQWRAGLVSRSWFSGSSQNLPFLRNSALKKFMYLNKLYVFISVILIIISNSANSEEIKYNEMKFFEHISFRYGDVGQKSIRKISKPAAFSVHGKLSKENQKEMISVLEEIVKKTPYEVYVNRKKVGNIPIIFSSNLYNEVYYKYKNVFKKHFGENTSYIKKLLSKIDVEDP